MNEPAPPTTKAPPKAEDSASIGFEDHPLATGVGAMGGAAAGATAGMVVAGPMGAVVGTLIGAMAGGLGGNAVAGMIGGPETAEAETVPWHEIIPSGLPSHEEIALRAYGYWEAAGRPDGEDLHHWLTAEESLKAETPGAAG